MILLTNSSKFMSFVFFIILLCKAKAKRTARKPARKAKKTKSKTRAARKAKKATKGKKKVARKVFKMNVFCCIFEKNIFFHFFKG